ncbi:MAG: hypothetical protein EB168_08375 [Euryarchaeota archaeon]|nr:hypothetical protein [Euryarchaeota archaeon]
MQGAINELKRRMIEASRRGAKRAGDEADSLRTERIAAILGRGMGERGAMSAEAIRSEAYGKGESPVTAATYGGLPPMSRESLQNVQAADIAGLMQQMKSPQKQQLVEALADRQIQGPKELIMRGGRAVMDAMADEGRKGDYARVGAATTVAGGLTASGAALVDLMMYMSQGQESASERDQVLPS